MVSPRKHFITAGGSFSMDGIFENIFAFVGKHPSNKQTQNPPKDEQRTLEKINSDWVWRGSPQKMRTDGKNKQRSGVEKAGCT